MTQSAFLSTSTSFVGTPWKHVAYKIFAPKSDFGKLDNSDSDHEKSNYIFQSLHDLSIGA